MSLSTHMLDTMHGRPGADVALRLFSDGVLLFEGWTDADGRCPSLRDLSLPRGRYSLEFGVAEYFRACGVALPEPPFLDRVTISFGIADAAVHHHVPLLASPYAYSSYRGS